MRPFDRRIVGSWALLSNKARKYPPEALRRSLRLGRSFARRALAAMGLIEPVWDLRLVQAEVAPTRPLLAVAIDLDAASGAASLVREALRRSTARIDEWLEWSACQGTWSRHGPLGEVTENGTLSGTRGVTDLLRSDLVFLARGDVAAMPPAHLETIAAAAVAEGVPLVFVSPVGPDPFRDSSMLVRRSVWADDGPNPEKVLAASRGGVVAKLSSFLGLPSPANVLTAASAMAAQGLSRARALDRYVVNAPPGGGSILHPISEVGDLLGGGAPADERPTVLLLLPYVAVGGVEKLTLDMMRTLEDHFRWVVVSLVPHDPVLGNRLDDFRALTPHVYLLGEALPSQLYYSAISTLLRRFDVRSFFSVNGTTWFYDALSTIRRDFPTLRILNQLYDHEVGWIEHYFGAIGRLIDVHVAINRRIAQTLVEERGVPAANVVVNFGGIDLTEFDPDRVSGATIRALREEIGVPDGAILVTLAGRMHPQKRPLDFLALAKRFTGRLDFFFLLAGGGPLEETLDSSIAGSGSNVKRLPFVSKMAELWAASDVGCLVSEYEGLPLVILEALAMKKPFLSTDVGGVRAILEEGPCGIVVDRRGDIAAFEAALQSLTDPERRRRMGEKGRRIVERDFSIQTAGRIYAEILDPGTRGPV
jgi:glycosyltransferase involved in cell wall biosynthesis